jgi:tetratricopeptide (TPR) repeat protein
MKQSWVCVAVGYLLMLGSSVSADEKKRQGEFDAYKGVGLIENFRTAFGEEKRGIELIHQRNWDQASARLKAAVKTYPELPKAHFWLGFAQEKLGHQQEAEKEYRTSLKLDTNAIRVWRALARILYTEGKYTEAREACANGIAMRPAKKQREQLDNMIKLIDAAEKGGHADAVNCDDELQ